MTEYERGNRQVLAAAFAALGLATILVPANLINTPAHMLFFDVVPRWVVGVIQIAAAALLLAPVVRPGFRRGLSIFGADLVCLMWASVALYPRYVDKVGNVISLASWALVAFAVHRLCLPEGMRRYPQGD